MEENKSMIEAIKEFIAKCPLLKDGKINVDYLGNEVSDYSIEIVPAEVVIQKYLDGSEDRQLVCVFASRASYSEDVIQNILNSKFYEEFSEWIETQNDNGILPEIDGIESIECTSPRICFSNFRKHSKIPNSNACFIYKSKKY